MHALVIYETLTGTTRAAAERIAAELTSLGVTATESSSRRVDLAALQRADVVVVGTWVDGLVLFGQRPGGRGELAKLPNLGGKTTYVYATYAIDAGRTLEKLTDIVTDVGGDVRGGMLIRRDRLEEGCIDFAERISGALVSQA